MAISAEWILNKTKQRIYTVTHAKAVVRNNSTVDADLAAIETTVNELVEEGTGNTPITTNEIDEIINSLN